MENHATAPMPEPITSPNDEPFVLGDMLDLFEDLPVTDASPVTAHRPVETPPTTDSLQPASQSPPPAPAADEKTAPQPPPKEAPAPSEPKEAELSVSAALEALHLPVNSEENLPEAPTETQTASAYHLPPELEQTNPHGGFFSTLLWAVGIVLMLAGLAMQYLYYHRLTLAENPQLRPFLAHMCTITGCRLPPLRDLSAIELGDHLVQSHPRYENSLLITATLLNRADFVQPFPVLEVVMTDLSQEEIARRRFLPEEYLVGDSSVLSFKPGNEVPLMLEVLDPGKQAVGFEFNFY